MGVVRSQALSNSIVSYVGIALGYLNIAILFPRILGTELLGLVQLVISTSTTMVQLGDLGISKVVIRYFPFFKESEARQREFLKLTLILLLVSISVLSLSIYVFEKQIANYFRAESAMFSDYILLLIPYIAFSIVANYLDSFNISHLRTMNGAIYKEVVVRLINLGCVLLFFFNVFNVDQFLIAFTMVQATYVIYLFAVLHYYKDFPFDLSFRKINIGELKDMARFGFASMLAGAGVIPNQISTIMVGALAGLTGTAIYGVTSAIGLIILIPSRSINRIGQTVIATAWQENDLRKLSRIYTKSATINFIFGTWLLVMLWINEFHIFKLLPAEYASGKTVLYILSIAQWIGVTSGVNGSILANSKDYYVNTAYNILSIGVIVGCNMLFIPIYGIAGAAMATFVTILLGNLIRYLFLKVKYGLDPFVIQQAYIVLIRIGSYLLARSVDWISNSFIDIPIRSVIISLVFVAPVYFLKLSADFNETVNLAIKKAQKYLFP